MTRAFLSFLLSSLWLTPGAQGFAPSNPIAFLARSTAIYSGKHHEDQAPKKTLPEGTLVEFTEKSRVHVGRIIFCEFKAGGGARYDTEDLDGKHYSIADKAVTYATPAPSSKSAANKLLVGLSHAQAASEQELRTELDISSDLLEMAWEEAIDLDDHTLTPKSLLQLVHSETVSALQSYQAWRLLRQETGHVFFRELKEDGRVVAFKAKARKAVDAAKRAFCDHHEDDELCFAA